MENLQKTCLYDRHIAANAKMSPFGGFIMPIEYTGIINEHNAVRHAAGMFDVSHMGEIFITGIDSEKFVNHVFTNDVSALTPGKIQYGMMLYPNGGTVDDLLVYKMNGDKWLLVVNAANIEKDYEWIKANSTGFDVSIDNDSPQWAQIALQGPEAESIAVKTLGLDVAELSFYSFKETEWQGKYLIVSRTGYTGEDGFELYSDPETIIKMWDMLAEAGVVLCGLGCRDTLRFEVGLPLYGHELSEDISPVEGGLGMFVKTDKPEFVGKEAIIRQKTEGITKKVVGIELADKAIPRAGYDVEADGKVIGNVTTGYNSISTGKSVCMALIDKQYASIGRPVEIRIRKKTFKGTVCKKRFYDKNYKK